MGPLPQARRAIRRTADSHGRKSVDRRGPPIRSSFFLSPRRGRRNRPPAPRFRRPLRGLKRRGGGWAIRLPTSHGLTSVATTCRPAGLPVPVQRRGGVVRHPARAVGARGLGARRKAAKESPHSIVRRMGMRGAASQCDLGPAKKSGVEPPHSKAGEAPAEEQERSLWVPRPAAKPLDAVECGDSFAALAPSGAVG